MLLLLTDAAAAPPACVLLVPEPVLQSLLLLAFLAAEQAVFQATEVNQIWRALALPLLHRE
jgi:hypothetical protein